jgi:hypothetical protein
VESGYEANVQESNISPMAPKKRTPAKLTSVAIERLAGKALENPAALTHKQTQELGGSVLRHIQNQKKLKPKKS